MNEISQHLTRVGLALLLGLTSLLVVFAAAAAFETPGTTSVREVTAGCVAAALSLAFCQFWLTPRGTCGFAARLPAIVTSLAPLLVVTALGRGLPITQALAWLASGCLGSVVGAVITQRVTATTRAGISATGPILREGSGRKCPRAGFVLLAAVAVMISLGVIPLVVAGATTDFSTGPTVVFLEITVGFALLAVMLLAFPLWNSRHRNHFSTSTLGVTAFLSLFLSMGCAMASQIERRGWALGMASMLLILCAISCLITTALMTVASVLASRDGARREDQGATRRDSMPAGAS